MLTSLRDHRDVWACLTKDKRAVRQDMDLKLIVLFSAGGMNYTLKTDEIRERREGRIDEK